MESSRYSNTTSFIDLLLLTLTGFVYLFVVAFMMMNPPDPSKMDPGTHIIVMMKWPTDQPHDIDLWVKLPNGKHVGYQQREHSLVHLDRDDRGTGGDSIAGPDGTRIVNPNNQEIISWRGLPPGTYIVNAHFYQAYTVPDSDAYAGGTVRNDGGLSVPIELELIQLNPNYKLLRVNAVKLSKVGDEATAFQFTITSTGKITNINEIQDHFVTRERFFLRPGVGDEER